MVEHWESCECRRCDQKRIADLRAEVERLREAMEKIANDKMLDIITATDIAVQALEERGRIAREALRQEGSEDGRN